MLLYLYISVLLALGLLLFVAPAHALAGVLLLYAIDQLGQASSPILANNPVLTNYVIACFSVAAAYIQFSKRGSPVFHFGGTFIATSLMLGFAFLSTSWAINTDNALETWKNMAPYLALILLISPNLIADSRDLNRTFSSLLILGAAVIFALTFFAEWGHRGVAIAGELDRYRNIATSNPLAAAQIGGYLALTAFGFILNDRNPLRRLAYGLIAISATILIVKSGSRGQLIALPIAIVFAYILTNSSFARRKTVAAVVPTLLVFFIAQQVLVSAEDIAVRWEGDQFSSGIDVRAYYFSTLLTYWMNSEWWTLLVGIGSTSAQHPSVIGTYPHFLALEVLTEYGVIGLLLLCYILFRTYRTTYLSARHSSAHKENPTPLWILAALFTFAFLVSFKQGNLLTNLDLFLFAILIDKQKHLRQSHEPRQTL